MNEFFQDLSQYHFFIPDLKFFDETALRIGGLSFYIAEFLMQFFIYPWVGIVICLLIAALSGYLSKHYFVALAMPLLCTDVNCFFQGLIGFLFVSASLWLYEQVKSHRTRIGALFLLTLFLFFVLPPSAYLFAITVLITDWGKRRVMTRIHIINTVVLALLLWMSLTFSITGSWKTIILPDAFYHPQTSTPLYIYALWALLPLSALCGLIPKKRIAVTAQAIVVASLVLFWVQTEQARFQKLCRLRTFDYYVWSQNWDAIIRNYPRKTTNLLELNLLNIALCQKQVNPNTALRYSQTGVTGLMVNWNKDIFVSTILSEVAFAAGDISSSQRYAFEALVSTHGYSNPRLLERLIQTNLIFGEYRVAQKYVRLLGKSWIYRSRAHHYQRLIDNPARIESNRQLAPLRRGLPINSRILPPDNLMNEIETIATENQDNFGARWYLSVATLLTQNRN